MSFVIAQVLGIIGTIVNIFSIQLKNKKDILFCFIVINFIFVLNLILLGGYTGAIVCFVAGVQTIIISMYELKNKKFPKLLIPVFLIVSIIFGSLTYKSLIDILPLFCSVTYTLSILQKKESNIRYLTLVNLLSWIIYDIFIMAYTTILSDLFMIVSTLIAIIRYDILSVIKNKKFKKLDEFTINCNKGLLVSDVISLENGKFVYSDVIEDNIWNFIADMNIKTKEEFEDVWKKNRKFMIDKNRIPAFYITPSSSIINNYKKILPDYMKIESNEIWMMFNNFNNIIEEETDIEINSNPTLKEFTDTLMDAYSSESETDHYGELPEYYRKKLLNYKKNKSDYKVNFYVAHMNKKPAATALTIEKENIVLIGFVETILAYRNKGICKKLMKKVLVDLKNKKIKTAFLQTEEGYIPEKLYTKLGFKKYSNAVLAVEDTEKYKERIK